MGWSDPIREARLHKWGSSAQPIYNWAADSMARPACVGHGPARPVYFLLLKFIHFFFMYF